MELKIENYAEWTAGMEQLLTNCATQQGQNPYKTLLCEKRLLIIERDSYARQLIQEVRDSIPEVQSEDHNDLTAEASSNPEWDWRPFREKMDKLLEYVRRKLW